MLIRGQESAAQRGRRSKCPRNSAGRYCQCRRQAGSAAYDQPPTGAIRGLKAGFSPPLRNGRIGHRRQCELLHFEAFTSNTNRDKASDTKYGTNNRDEQGDQQDIAVEARSVHFRRLEKRARTATRSHEHRVDCREKHTAPSELPRCSPSLSKRRRELARTLFPEAFFISLHLFA